MAADVSTVPLARMTISVTGLMIVTGGRKDPAAAGRRMADEILEIANSEARSISQVCELLLAEGVEAYKKEGPKFIQRLVAKQKSRAK